MIVAQAAILAATRAARRGGVLAALQAGFFLAASILTRHVGVVVAAAVGVHLCLQKRVVYWLTAVITASICLLPWVVWIATVQHNTQVELLVQPGLFARVIAQGFFYLQRLPDQLTGPVVEVGTVFTRSAVLSTLVTIWATFASGLLIYGWIRSVRTRRALAGLIGLFTLGLLVVWPFTEAGRFLIPLVPCLLIAAVEGLAPLLWRFGHRLLPRKPLASEFDSDSRSSNFQDKERIGEILSRAADDSVRGVEFEEKPNYSTALGRESLAQTILMWVVRHPKTTAAAIVLAVSAPYSLYATASGRSDAARKSYEVFDQACSWLASEADVPGPILARDPGEVYWLSGRQAIPPGNTVAEIFHLLVNYRVAYLLIDDGRYANAALNPLSKFVVAEPTKVRQVWSRNSKGSSIRIFEVLYTDGQNQHQRLAPSNLRSP
jgi:hypothetical protein